MGEYYDWKLGRFEASLKEAVNTALREGVNGRDINAALRSAMITGAEHSALTVIHATQAPRVAANKEDGAAPV